jgi:phage gpG-like protein
VSGISVRVLLNDLPLLAASLPQRARTLNRQTAFRIEATWKAGVRVKTGNLRRSIHTADGAGASVVVATNVDYAGFENYGTRRMSGSFAREKAVERHRAGHVAAMRGLLGR